VVDGRVSAVRVWDRHIASVVSLVASPPVLIVAAMAIQAHAAYEPGVWSWVWLYAGLAVVLPLVYLVQLVWRGRVGDLHIETREERFSPLGVMVISVGLAWFVFFLRGAPAPMTVLAGVLFVMSALIFAVTLFWKISVHCASAGLVGILAGGLTGSAVPAVVTVSVMSWSRWRLNQHTPAQAAAGTLLGVLASVVVGALM